MAVYPEAQPDAKEIQEHNPPIDLAGLLLLLARYSRKIAVFTLASLILGTVVAMLLKPVYTATAIILPPQQEQSSASSLLGSLMMLGGGGASSFLRNPADMYVGILQSNTIADWLIHKFNLQRVYKTGSIVDTRKALEKHASFLLKKDGLIYISVKDHSPQRASNMANAFIEQLYQMNSSLAISEASQRRLFFNKEVDQERKALDEAEDALATVQVKTGVIQLNGQAEILLHTIAQVRAQITSDQVELEGLLTSATNENPSVQRLKHEIASLRTQLNSLERNRGKVAQGDMQVSASSIPKVALEYTQRLRDVKYHEALFNLLSKQYAAARIDEAKSAPLIQVVDRATPPDKRSGPARWLIIVGAGLFGLLLGCFYAMASNTYLTFTASPIGQEQLKQLQQALHSKAE